MTHEHVTSRWMEAQTRDRMRMMNVKEELPVYSRHMTGQPSVK